MIQTLQGDAALTAPRLSLYGVHDALAAAGITIDGLRHPITFFDTETTDLNCREDDIIEFAALRFEPNEQGTIWTLSRIAHQYFTPRVDIGVDAAEVHGITNEVMAAMTADGRAVKMTKKHLDDIKSMFADSLIVAHNIRFDMGFLESAFRRFKMTLGGYIAQIDTVNYGKLRFPRNKVNLDALCRALKVSNKARADYHGALVDTEILSRVFEKLVNPPPENDLFAPLEKVDVVEEDKRFRPARGLVKLSEQQKEAYAAFRASCGL